MGGAPLLALNLVAWPREGLPFELLARVIDGGADVARAAGALIAGGHSIDDPEPKYGLAVVGTVEPDRVWRNTGGRPGDVLVLTKPIGLGVISTAVKRAGATRELLATAIEIMTALNAGARDAGRALGDAIHGATDVTGFGLLGHLGELARGSGVGAVVERDTVPVIDGVPALVRDGFVAGGTQRNHAFVSEFVDWGTTPADDQLLLADAQTSGGLLFAVDPDAADALVAGLQRVGTLAAARIGQLTAGPPGAITVT
jgi:selenide,water dikinase